MAQVNLDKVVFIPSRSGLGGGEKYMLNVSRLVKNKFFIITSKGDIEKILLKEKIDYMVIENRSIVDFKFAFNLYKTLKKLMPATVISSGYRIGFYTSIIKFFLKFAHIHVAQIEISKYDVSILKKSIYRMLFRISLFNIDTLVCVSSLIYTSLPHKNKHLIWPAV